MSILRIRLRDASWAIVAGALQSVGPFGTFLILARLTDPAELGRYSLSVAIAVPIFLVTRMQLRQASVADPSGGAAFGSYQRLRLASATLALVMVGAFAGISSPPLGSILAAFAFVRWAEDIADIHYAPLQRAARWSRIVCSQLVRVLGSLSCLAFAWHALGLPLALLLVGLWQLAVTLLVDLPAARSLEPGGAEWGCVRRLLHSNWPLGGAAAIVSLLTYTPRFALAWAHGEVPVGEYAALGQVALLGNLAVQGAGQASLARLGVGFIQSRQDFARHVVELLVLASAVALVGGVAATLWGGAVLAWLFQPRFGSLSGALVGMMVASAFVYSTSVFGYALTAAGVKRAQIAIFGTALLVGGIAAFPLCAGYGLGGAIASSILSWAVATALSGTLLYRLCGRRPTGVRTVAHGVREGGAV